MNSLVISNSIWVLRSTMLAEILIELKPLSSLIRICELWEEQTTRKLADKCAELKAIKETIKAKPFVKTNAQYIEKYKKERLKYNYEKKKNLKLKTSLEEIKGSYRTRPRLSQFLWLYGPYRITGSTSLVPYIRLNHDLPIRLILK